MNSFESGLLQFLAAVAPTIGTLFIHNQKSVAIFNASDALFQGVVQHITTQQAVAPTAAPTQP